MRKLFVIMAAVLFKASVFAQSPEKMSYQAVIRDASDNLITNTQISMQISILQGSTSGTAVYIETQEPTTNANGLVSIEIGAGKVQSGGFSAIDWANGPYFIKTETDPDGANGGIAFTITGTSQLLSVPYALHAKTAESVSGTITEIDPIFGASIASGITGADTTNWNNKLDSYTETDPIFGASVASGITGADTTSWNNKLDSYTETDPIFGASVASGITGADTSNWNNKTNSYIETDPIFGASVASGITGTDTTNWNNKQDQLIAGTNITIVGNTISATGGGSSNNFYLGQDTLGGIIFYIYLDQNGDQHGLILNKTDSTAEWQSSITTTTTNAIRSWDGVYNMALMTGSPAETYVTALTNGGFNDWYLPSIDELSILWYNRFHANKALNSAGAGATLLSTTSIYWSSTEYSATRAFAFDFYGGYTMDYGKTDNYSVRAIRAF